MILRLYWRIIQLTTPEDSTVRVRVVIAHQPHDEGKLVGELHMSMREYFNLQQMHFQTEFYDEAAPN